MKTKSENTETPAVLVRLQQFMDLMKLSVYQMNKDAGLSKGLLTNAINKGQGLTATTLEAILNTYPQINANWLICGRGNMLNDTDAPAPSASQTQQHLAHLDRLQQQAVELIKTIQQLKQEEQSAADQRLLDSLGIGGN